MSPKPVRIGGVEVERELALESARSYLSRRDRFGYPAYDSFGSEGGPWRVSDADLVAPVLLNAEMNSRTFYALEGIREHLEAGWSMFRSMPGWSRPVRRNWPSSASCSRCWTPTICRSTPADRMLAKVMHRKRPAFIPLYDRFVDYCYRGVGERAHPEGPQAGLARLPAAARPGHHRRPAGGSGLLREVAGLANGPVITPLRALDIVAWHAGRSQIGPAIWSAATPPDAADGTANAARTGATRPG